MLTSKYEEKIYIYLIHDKFFSVGYNFLFCFVGASGLEVVTVLVWGVVLLVSFPPVNERALNLP
jgi:hypothetical protein